MRCKTCDYRLWNLESRQCPECGTAFVPSQFEFVPNTVQFCCPHCQQPYYGTGPKGHLVPSTFACVKCGESIGMDRMVLRPTEGVVEEQTAVAHLPWLERRRRGRVRALLATAWMAMIGPTRVVAMLPDDREAKQAWWFAFLVNGLGVTLGLSIFFVFPLVFVVGVGGRRGGASAALGILLALVIMLVCILVGTLVSILLWSLVTHGILRLTGGTDRKLRSTAQILCYSTGPNIMIAVPCLGLYLSMVSWIWCAVSAIFMVKETHKVGGGRAALAVLTFPVASSVTVFVLYGWLMFRVVTMAGAVPTTAAVTRMVAGETQAVVDAVRSFAAANGRYPNHAIELALLGDLGAGEFVLSSSDTYQEDVPVGPGSLMDFEFAGRSARQEAARAAEAALPDGVIAHRLGDFVFTFHGMRPASADPGLWIVIVSPDPSANATVPFDRWMVVGRADGTIERFSVDVFGAARNRQNALRAQYSLPPLPSPRTITHESPAVGPSPADRGP